MSARWCRHGALGCLLCPRPVRKCRRCRLPQEISSDHDPKCTWHPRNRVEVVVVREVDVDEGESLGSMLKHRASWE